MNEQNRNSFIENKEYHKKFHIFMFFDLKKKFTNKKLIKNLNINKKT